MDGSCDTYDEEREQPGSRGMYISSHATHIIYVCVTHYEYLCQDSHICIIDVDHMNESCHIFWRQESREQPRPRGIHEPCVRRDVTQTCLT